ncbi:MAG: acyltransferase [Deltaproteobacteria bacterium]|nr:acyltransferase [Deltaproteobacteria bacterium]
MNVSDKKPFAQQTQEQLKDCRVSAWRRYALLTVGRSRFGALLLYELITGTLCNFPGMAGFWLRQKFYRYIVSSLGKGVIIGRNVTIRGGAKIDIGDHVSIDDNVVIDARGENGLVLIGSGALISRNTILRARNASLTVGEGSDVGANCILATDSNLEVGKDVLIAAYSYLCAGGNHAYDRTDIPMIRQGFVSRGGVVIEDDVWIGSHAMIMDGVHIGKGSIIGVHSLVNKDIAEGSIAFGQPAVTRGNRMEGAGAGND